MKTLDTNRSKDKGAVLARISGVDLPRNKKIEFALQYIYGIGKSYSKNILEKTNINPDVRVNELK